MLNIPEYKEYGGETRIALMDNSSLAFMHELSQRSYPADRILGVYDLILIPKWVMEEIEDSTYRSTYVEQLQAQGYDVDLLHDIQFKRPFKDSIEDQKHDMHSDRYAHRVQESCANLRRIIDLKCVENNTRHDQIHENYGQNLAV